MTLPPITIPVEIPQVVLDFIPALIHPAVVHFAIVLPLIILFLELVNLVMKRRSLTVSIYLLFLLVMVVFVAAYVTGGIDGKEAYPLLSGDGKAELKEHKLLGTYLVYLTLLPVVFKMLSVLIKKAWFRIIYMLILAGFVGLTLFQGKEGGELVYKHGANVQMVSEAQDKAEEFELEVEDLDGQIEELDGQIEELEAEVEVLKSLAAKAAVSLQQSSAPAVTHYTEPAVEIVEHSVEAHVAPVVEEAVAEHVQETVEVVETQVQEAIPVVEEHVEAAVEEHTAPVVESVIDAVEEHTSPVDH